MRWKEDRESIRSWQPATALILLGSIALVLVLAVGLLTWIHASKGSKEVDLGSSLISGAVVGAILLVVGKSYDLTTSRPDETRD